MFNRLLMSEVAFWTLMFMIPVAMVVIALICYFVFQYPKDKAKNEARKQAFYDECEKEPEYVFKQAKITSMRNHVYYQQNLGFPQMPQKVDEYYVTFLNEDGEEKEYLVSQEFFYNVVKGEEGTLVTVNGNFFDFGDGIDVVVEEEAPETIKE